MARGQGITMVHNTLSLLMRRPSPRRLSTHRRQGKPTKPSAVSRDLVKRNFIPAQPNDLWLAHITEHPTRDGNLFRDFVSDAFSRRVVGWVIDTSARAGLATNAPGTAFDSRGRFAGGIARGDHGAQFTSWTFTGRSRRAGLLPSLGSAGDPHDNAVAEAFWARMHIEPLNRQRWAVGIG